MGVLGAGHLHVVAPVDGFGERPGLALEALVVATLPVDPHPALVGFVFAVVVPVVD